MKKLRNRIYRKATPEESQAILEDMATRARAGLELQRALQKMIPLEKIKESIASLPEDRQGQFQEQISEMEKLQNARDE